MKGKLITRINVEKEVTEVRCDLTGDGEISVDLNGRSGMIWMRDQGWSDWANEYGEVIDDPTEDKEVSDDLAENEG